MCIRDSGIGVGFLGVSNRRVVNDRDLIATPIFNVVIQRHVRGIHFAIGKPVENTVFVLRQDFLLSLIHI